MSLRPESYNKVLTNLDKASREINAITDSYSEVLTFDENTDVLLPSGKFAKSLDKRLKEQFSQSVVKIVNDKTGVVKFVNANSKGWSYGANVEVLGYRKTVTNSTGATVNLSTAFTCSIYTNNATAAAIDFKLPKAESGIYYTFHVTKATQLKISPNVADTIIGYTVGTPISSSTINDTVTLVAISATEWIMTSKIGNWV